jgi:FtsP/CotA-like multicopper oxidase with cupredoxin domain
MKDDDVTAARVSRRGVLALTGGILAAAGLSACQAAAPHASHLVSDDETAAPSCPTTTAAEPEPDPEAMAHRVRLAPRPVTADLAGRLVETWAYQGELPGPTIRVSQGDTLAVTVQNGLPDDTTVHWHGIAIRNASDGAPDITQPPIEPGQSFSTTFVVPHAGTYWYHTHVGVQLDRGLYGALIVTDPADPGVDVDEVIILDDWFDGIAGTPDEALVALAASHGGGPMPPMPAMQGGAAVPGAVAHGLLPATPMLSPALGGVAGAISYPLHLVNGRSPGDRPTYRAAPGDRVRLRFINAGSDTAYRIAVGGHQLTVTHADGHPVQPVGVDTLIIGMGERYDVTFVARSGVWPVHAAAEGKPGAAVAVLRTSDSAVSKAPPLNVAPGELSGRRLSYAQLRPTAGTALPAREPDQQFVVTLTGGVRGKDGVFFWSLGGDAERLRVHEGDRVRITMVNHSPAFHPMHLHGHIFGVVGPGARKDTVNVLPGQTVRIDVDADNPGDWMYHCHNTYHSVMGMMTTLTYV